MIGGIVHNVGHYLLDYGAKSAGTGLAANGDTSRFTQCLFRNFELNALHIKELLILLNDAISGLGKNLHKVVFAQFIKARNDRYASYKFGNETEANQILRLYACRRSFIRLPGLCLAVNVAYY